MATLSLLAVDGALERVIDFDGADSVGVVLSWRGVCNHWLNQLEAQYAAIPSEIGYLQIKDG